ncbi:MAG: hypothetical protein F6K14_28630 [Symploca sp. SIO2C1]|nr:hypothetical protein [Symploca sp. SIO2C1]
MRPWQFWWRTLVIARQYNPPEFVEHLMLFCMMGLGIRWILGMMGMLALSWPYQVLSASFAIGAAVSMAIREIIIPSPRPRVVIVFAIVVVLSYALFAFTDLVRYYY